jgi:hypothetical protein
MNLYNEIIENLSDERINNIKLKFTQYYNNLNKSTNDCPHFIEDTYISIHYKYKDESKKEKKCTDNIRLFIFKIT